MWHFYDRDVCSAEELQEIVVMVTKDFLMVRILNK